MNALRKIAAGSLAAVLACSMAACGSGNANSTDSASNTGKTVKVDEKSAKATSISDFGGMDAGRGAVWCLTGCAGRDSDCY